MVDGGRWCRREHGKRIGVAEGYDWGGAVVAYLFEGLVEMMCNRCQLTTIGNQKLSRREHLDSGTDVDIDLSPLQSRSSQLPFCRPHCIHRLAEYCNHRIPRHLVYVHRRKPL